MLWWTLRQCRSENLDVRLPACKKLADIRDPRHVARLLTTYDGYDVEVWLSAALAIDKMQWDAVPPLLEALKHPDAKMRAAAAIVLGSFPDPNVLDALLRALKDEDKEVRKRVASALGKIGKMRWEAVPPLKEVPKRVASALAKIGDRSSVEPLLEAMKDKDEAVRDEAAEALDKIGCFRDPGFRDALLRALKNEDKEVRERMTEALRKIGDESAVEPLLEALKSKDAEVQKGAAEALDKIGAPVSPTPAGALPNSVVIFREGADAPPNALAYTHQVFSRRYKCDTSQLALSVWRIVGVRDAFDTAFATSLFAQLKRTGQLPDLGPVSDMFEGKGPDGRIVVAFFFAKVSAGTPPKARAAVDISNPVCSSCGKSLGPGTSIFGGAQVISTRPASEVQDDYTLFTGSICFNCRAVFCVDCLAGRVDQCPKCQAATKPAYRRHLRELGALVT